MEDQANILARAASDADDRLLTAEEPLASLQLRCGGELPGTIAPPELRELVRKARALLAACDCRAGCPACVGPVLAADETSTAPPKSLANQVLALLEPARTGSGSVPASGSGSGPGPAGRVRRGVLP